MELISQEFVLLEIAGYGDSMMRLETGGHCEPANFLNGRASCTDPGTRFVILPVSQFIDLYTHSA